MAYLNTQPFGSRRAPANWARVTQFVVFVPKRVFRVWLGVYVDGLFCLEPDAAIESARHFIEELRALLGMEIALDKEVAPTFSAILLGAQVTLSRVFAHASIPRPKASKIIDEINDILKANTLSPAQAAKLRGKLGFAQSLLFGRFGRALLKPIAERQYSQVRRRAPHTNKTPGCSYLVGLGP